jgi:hypothetical protein
MSRLKNILRSEPSLYIYSILLCFLFLFWILQLWNADFYIPFDYHWDALNTGASIKGMIDNGWYVSNNYIGAPYGSLSYDFTANVNLDMGIMKIISLIVPSWAFTFNVYFLLTFVLVTITTLLVFRKLGISPLVSIVGSLLFAFAPYHFLQGELHLNLSAYYLIPLIVLVCLWLFENDFSLKLYRTCENGKNKVNGRAVGAILICVFTGTTFIYYPFFSCFFLIIAGAGAAIAARKWQPLFNSFILILIVIAVVLAFDIPSLLYQAQNGSNQALTRNPGGSEIWGLKIIQLLLPVSQNRNPFLAAFTDRYDSNSILNNESTSAALGIIGSIGFMFLVAWLFYGIFNKRTAEFSGPFKRISNLSVFTLAATILGTVGGLGALIAYTVFPSIRTYTRISIFIAFFSVLTVLFIIDYLVKRTTFSKTVVVALLVIFLVVGINDQTSPAFIPDYAANKAQFTNDDDFVKSIEREYPNDNLIFQLPYVAYPEGSPTGDLTDYDLLRGFLHSTHISWSYGAMKGRYGDFWQQTTIERPVDQMVKMLSFAGFNGVYIDKLGFTDYGKDIINTLSPILNVEPLVSKNKQLAFFDMTYYNKQLKTKYSIEEYEVEKLNALYPLWPQFIGGFLPQSVVNDENRELSKSNIASITITNLMSTVRKVDIKATFTTGSDVTSSIEIKGETSIQNIQTNSDGYCFSGEFVLQPGENVIEIKCNAKPVYDSTRGYNLVFAMDNFQMTELH